MSGTRWACIAALLGIAITGMALWDLRPREPSYHGRSLSSWLKEWDNSYYDRTNSAAIAIRAIGSNGVPILLARLSKETSPSELKFWRFAWNAVPDKLNPVLRNSGRALEAAEAINFLGGEARSAFPSLTNLWSRRPHRLTAAIALAGIGHDGISVLLQALTNQDWVIRFSAANALAEAGSDLDKVVPALVELVRIRGNGREDSLVRGAAGSSLVHLHKEPELVVPAFSEFLASPDAGMRAFGASLLGGMGADAKSAVPLLVRACTDEDADVREAAQRALKNIAPDAAGKAGLK